jgi:hypothetical protein
MRGDRPAREEERVLLRREHRREARRPRTARFTTTTPCR